MSGIGASLTDFRWKVDAYIKQEKCSFCHNFLGNIYFQNKTNPTKSDIWFENNLT